MRFFPIVPVAAALLLAGCDKPATQSISVDNAWVRLPAAPGRPGAAYFTLRAGDADVLTQVASPATPRVEMHESMDGATGMASMRPLDTLALAPGEEVRFESGGKHVMLYDLDPALKPGGTIPLTLRFAKAPPVTVTAAAVGAGDPPPFDR